MSSQGINPEAIEQSHGIMDKIRGTRVGTALAVVGSALAMGGAANEVINPDPAQAAFEWEHVGGDPFVDGGIQTKDELEAEYTKPRGKQALRELGLNGQEVSAVIDAIDDDDGDRNVRNCTLHKGDKFDSMVFGDTGVIATDVTYTGEAEPAYCVDVKMPNGKVINVKIPKGCGNAALNAVRTHTPPKHPPKKPPTGFVNIKKHALTANDELIVPTPSGIFRFDASCKVPGQKERVHNVFTYNPNGKNRPVRALTGCKVGSVAIVKELPTLGPDQWEMLSPVVQKQEIERGKNLFAYKDRQVRPGQPNPDCVELGNCPQPPNSPPSGRMNLHQRIANTTDKVCVDDLRDPNGDAVRVTDFTFTNSGGGTVGMEKGPIYQLPLEFTGGEVIYCQDYTTPSTPQEVNIHAFLTDGKPNGNTTLFNTMPVTPEQL